MKKMELVSALAEKAGLSRKDTEKVLRAFVETVTEEMKNGGRVQLAGFGTFETVNREAREGRNPRTGETMMISASRIPRFKASKTLKEQMNE